ncbi:MAG: MerR family transcriptional regulator [Hyphomicrobiaceae bacterium]|nr:MerR family transcriptional regulator [Hyphomicrobiaceae bacterium]
MPKAIEAFRNITEVSHELGVKKHVLRFWETKFPQLKPMKRGGGRRYYRPADVELLRGIRHLLQAEGYSARGVQKILREGGAKRVKRVGKGAAPAKRRVLARTKPNLPAPSLAPSPPGLVPPLNAAHVGTLRDVVAELAALQTMLRDVEGER